MEGSFQCAKREIVSLIKKELKIYQLGKPTSLVTDWTKTGVGYVL